MQGVATVVFFYEGILASQSSGPDCNIDPCQISLPCRQLNAWWLDSPGMLVTFKLLYTRKGVSLPYDTLLRLATKGNSLDSIANIDRDHWNKQQPRLYYTPPEL